MDGLLLINKEKGITSFGVVNQVKKKLNIKKVGHTGTLDPGTEGLLVLALGRGTKFIEEITKDSQKVYVATMKFGILTDTYDIYGNIIKEEEYIFNEMDVINTMKSFIKTYNQVPPVFSAKKINGKRAYEYAFENKTIDMTKSAKEITIYNLEILQVDNVLGEVIFKACVSKGCYVRSLIYDIAQSLGTIATMTYLKRESTDGFDIKDAHRLDEDLKSNIISLDDFVKEKYTGVYEVDGKLAKLIQNGSRFTNPEIIKKFDKFINSNQINDNKILFIDKNTKKNIAIYAKKDNAYLMQIMLMEN